jgi:dipeptidyl aminopeptidase/acylaminoacyl peptidase
MLSRFRPIIAHAMYAMVCLCVLVAGLSIDAQAARLEQGNLVTENVPDVPQTLAARLQQYTNTRAASMADWHPRDGSLLITTRFGEAAQLHRVAVPLGARRQVTFFDEPLMGGAYTADGQGVIYVRDIGGNEDYQIYRLDLASGRSTLLTDGASRHSMPLLSADRRRMAFSSNQRNGRDVDIYVADVTSPEAAKMVYAASGSWSADAWSADGTQLAITQYVSISDSRIVLLNLSTGTTQQIKPKAGTAALSAPRFSADAQRLFYTSDDGTDFAQLRVRDLRTNAETILTANAPWDVTDVKTSEDGAVLAYVINEDGVDSLRLIETATQNELARPPLPPGQVGKLTFSPDGKQLAFSMTTDTRPSDVYVADVRTGAVTRWTESEVGGLNPETFVSSRKIRYPTFDKVAGKPRQIPALVYTPRSAPGPYPVIIQIHGGPEGQERAGFVSETQALVNELGAVVIKPNVRGSTGYGKAFHTLDNAAKREDSVRDIGALLDWIATQPDLDSKRVVVYGGSYGGYMVLASMVSYSDRLAGGIDVVGISNFITFLTNTRGYRQDLRRMEYGDERDPKMRAIFERISPLNNVERITKPLLIVQGQNDPRVPVTESEQMLSALKAKGNTVWYLMAKDEGHGFRKKSNRAYQQQVQFMFLEKVFGNATN